MQKPKNLLPGLFLCVFSRTVEPLVDFYCSKFWIFLFLFGADFFTGKKGVSGPFYTGPFYTGPFCAPIPQKTPRTPRLYSAALFGMPPRPKGPNTKVPEGSGAPKDPTQKTPGVSPGVWLMKNSFNLRLTHCGRFLAGCTGLACSRRPQ